MRKKRVLLLAVLLVIGLAACRADAGSSKVQKLTVGVGIVPQAAFVEAVAKDLVNVVAMVPPGDNPETFSPSMVQMKALSNAAVYFTLNLPTEQASILPKLKDFNTDIYIVDLEASVASVYPMLSSDHGHGDAHDVHDHHIWLSPKRAVVMVQTIADSLCEIDQENAEAYQANASSYIKELKTLDSDLKQAFESLESRSFFIYHGAYAYFAEDYGLEMVAVEVEGKQASAADLKAVISLARQKGIKTVLYQQEYDSSQARTLAQEIGGKAVEVTPLSGNYINAMRHIASALTGELNEQDDV